MIDMACNVNPLNSAKNICNMTMAKDASPNSLMIFASIIVRKNEVIE